MLRVRRKRLTPLGQARGPEDGNGGPSLSRRTDDGWKITVEGEDSPVGSYDTKKEAVSTARSTAKEQAPSQLVIHKQDRSVQESFSYDADDA